MELAHCGTGHSHARSALMRRYHFHIIDGVKVFDPQGAFLVDDSAARKHAEALARSIQKSELADKPSTVIRVTNEDGEVLFRVPVRDEL